MRPTRLMRGPNRLINEMLLQEPQIPQMSPSKGWAEGAGISFASGVCG